MSAHTPTGRVTVSHLHVQYVLPWVKTYRCLTTGICLSPSPHHIPCTSNDKDYTIWPCLVRPVQTYSDWHVQCRTQYMTLPIKVRHRQVWHWIWWYVSTYRLLWYDTVDTDSDLHLIVERISCCYCLRENLVGAGHRKWIPATSSNNLL